MKAGCLKANVSSAKMNILLDGAITAKVNLNILLHKEIPDYLLSRNKTDITCLCLCTDNKKVLLIIFSVEIVWYLFA